MDLVFVDNTDDGSQTLRLFKRKNKPRSIKTRQSSKLKQRAFNIRDHSYASTPPKVNKTTKRRKIVKSPLKYTVKSKSHIVRNIRRNNKKTQHKKQQPNSSTSESINESSTDYKEPVYDIAYTETVAVNIPDRDSDQRSDCEYDVSFSEDPKKALINVLTRHRAEYIDQITEDFTIYHHQLSRLTQDDIAIIARNPSNSILIMPAYNTAKQQISYPHYVHVVKIMNYWSCVCTEYLHARNRTFCVHTLSALMIEENIRMPYFVPFKDEYIKI